MNARIVIAIVATIAVIAGALTLGQSSTPPTATDAMILIDGSSTVAPLTEAAAENYAVGNIVIDISGTGGGFKRFCAGETDLQNASRPIKAEEKEACAAQNVDWYEVEIAYDGITLVTSKDNTWLSCLTVDQLNQLWRPDSTVTLWSDLDPTFPQTAVELYGPGADSGTFDYFTQVIVGTTGSARTDYSPSEDDHMIIEGASSSDAALGFVGYSYAHENSERVKIVAVDGGGGCVTPTATNITDGTYAPLARPLYLYINANSIPKVADFLRSYVANLSTLIADTGLVPAPAKDIADLIPHVEAIIAGSIAPDSAT